MYEISLDEKDYLEYHLYTASKSKRIKNITIRRWIISVASCLILSFIAKDKEFLSNYFLGLAAISFIFFPFYIKWSSKKHYLKFIRERHKNNFGVNCIINFNSGQICAKDKSGEAKINISEIAEVNEIADQIFIKFKTATALIIPKKKVDVETFKNELKSHINDLGIKWNEELSWRWKYLNII